jgi:outer membrane immunogenic protein
MRNLTLTILISAGVAGLAIAAPAHAAKFDGGRIELRGGWDAVKLNGEVSTTNPALSAKDHKTESGFGFGLEAGYDYMIDKSVLIGAYAGVDFSSADFCKPVFGGDEACLKAGRDWSIGVRAGVPVADNFLIYVKGGYSNGKLEAKYHDLDGFVTVNPPLNPPVAIASFDDSKSTGGIHFGIGGEMTFGSNFYGKVEWVLTNYSNGNFNATNVHLGLDAKRSKVFVGAGIRF